MDPAARLLRLLSLLQAQPKWAAAELASRLGVGERTIRRDVTRLRALGYPVTTSPGLTGYELGAGGRLPPLLLDDDEAVAIALGLRLATTAAITGVEASAVAALAKIDQVLPSHVRERIHALETATIHLQRSQAETVDAETLIILTTGSRRRERVTFTYSDHAGTTSRRRTEPFRVVHTGRRWYLVARDVDRDDWRTFRVDRVTEPELTGHQFELKDPPDAAARVLEGLQMGRPQTTGGDS
jgi:predicted DNA-binding transcriptional regulator YafY